MNMIIKKHWKIFLAFFVPLLVVNAVDFYLLLAKYSVDLYPLSLVDQYSEVLHKISLMSYFPTYILFNWCLDRPCDNAAWFEPVFFITAMVLMPAVWGVIGVGIVRIVQKLRFKISRKQ